MNSSPSVATSAPALGEFAHNRDGGVDTRRKANGVYYTPPRLARLLATWALAHDPERILEPAFGEGVSLRAAYQTLTEAGVVDPAATLYGVEVDPLGAQRVRDSGLDLRAGHLDTTGNSQPA